LLYIAHMPFKDPERRREYGRQWMRSNLDKARDAMRRWRANNPERDRERRRADYARRPDVARAQSASYARTHPQVRRTRYHNRRARVSSAGGTFTTAEWQALVEQYGGRCAYCGALGPLVVEHRIPLSRGGTNDISNILPACARCNDKKHCLTEEEFRARLDKDGRFDA
jgi:5-methylcytosine-specific restriction endonuclease McrA